MKITWIGHACFKIEQDGYSVIFDPYKTGSVPGYSPIKETADQVICSHQHGDHAGSETVTLVNSGAPEMKITVLQTYHDHHQGTKRGKNLMHIVEAGGERAAHLGDLGCALTEEQKVALSNLDVLLIPIGDFYTIGAKEAAGIAKELKPKYVVPMHFRNEERKAGYNEIATVDEFVALMGEVSCLPTATLDTKVAQKAGTVVLTPANLEN